MSIISASHPTGRINGTIRLDGSKSISNRALIIKALSGLDFPIHHLGESDDIETMIRLLSQTENLYDTHHAGTTYRFMTAYLALQQGRQVLTGSARMKERPIGPLVEALRSLNCNIHYLEEEGYPPLAIESPGDMSHITEVTIDAGISSQYITALILIAPILPNGLIIHLRGDMVSESYLKMTMATVSEFGIKVDYNGQSISIAPQLYKAENYTIEADWSAASYHYALVALSAEGSEVRLQGLFKNSTQGDAEIKKIAPLFGVKTSWEGDDCILTKCKSADLISYNFINQPDIAQTLAVICAAKNIKSDFSGLKTLRIKETDRIYAVDTELKKIGGAFSLLSTEENGEEHYGVNPIIWNANIPRFNTYRDHRMPMSFAPLALHHPIEFENPEVVSKSYKDFWEDLKSLGFKIETIR